MMAFLGWGFEGGVFKIKGWGLLYVIVLNWSAWTNPAGTGTGSRKMRCGGTTFLPRGVECLMMTKF